MSSENDRLFPGRVFIETVLDATDTKVAMARRLTVPYLQRAAMAGILIGLFYCAYFAVAGTFTQFPAGDGSWLGAGKILGSFIFGWALVFIYFTKSELLTSNMMVVSIAVYYRRLKPFHGLMLLFWCLLGNALGGLILAALLKFTTLINGAALDQMQAAVDTKLAYVETAAGLGDLFLRAVLCNLLINVAMLLVYNGYIRETITMSLTMMMAVFLFAFLGLEHSVANTVLFTVVGLAEDIDVGAAAANVGIALVGNFIGGGLLVGVYYAHVNDNRRLERKLNYDG